MVTIAFEKLLYVERLRLNPHMSNSYDWKSPSYNVNIYLTMFACLLVWNFDNFASCGPCIRALNSKQNIVIFLANKKMDHCVNCNANMYYHESWETGLSKGCGTSFCPGSSRRLFAIHRLSFSFLLIQRSFLRLENHGHRTGK